MPADLTALDATALVVFAVIWLGFNMLFDGRFRRPNSINALMLTVREAWMRELLSRDNRIMDATLIGHAIRTAQFFASTTIILIAGLAGVLGSADVVHNATTRLALLLPTATQSVLEFKILLLIGIFVYAFFKFTWAIRQFNYFTAIVGSAPAPHAREPDRELPKRMAMILSHAVWQINAGVRAYYFAFAVLGWLVHPLLFIGMTVLMVLVLVRRQLTSATAQAIAAHVQCLRADDAKSGAEAAARDLI